MRGLENEDLGAERGRGLARASASREGATSWSKLLAKLTCRLRRSPLGSSLAQRTARRMIAEKRFEDADVLLADALAARPADPGLLTVHAESAHGRGAYAEAVERWTRARRAGGDELPCTAAIATNLRALGEHAAAQELIDEALARAPNNLMVVTEAARLARARNRPRESCDLWLRAIRRKHPHPDWLQGYAQGLCVLGDFAVAERVLASARRCFPDHQGLRAAQGAIPVARQDWATGVAFWTDYRRDYPNDATGWEQLGIALQGRQMHATADAAAPAHPTLADIAVVEDEPMRRLVLRFESIGDSCEMGLVQRRYGAEPLGLFRWNDVRLDNLVTALEHRLDGMGTPENTDIIEAANGEFYIEDRRWSLAMHTFLFAGHVDKDDIYRKMCRRIVYLRDKLLDDLAAAEKIFVYRSPDVDEAALRRLHGALRAFGPVTLLGVQPVMTPQTRFPGRPVGEVAQLDEKLYVGFLSRPGCDALGNWDIAFDDWTRVFASALTADGAPVTA